MARLCCCEVAQLCWQLVCCYCFPLTLSAIQAVSDSLEHLHIPGQQQEGVRGGRLL